MTSVRGAIEVRSWWALFGFLVGSAGTAAMQDASGGWRLVAGMAVTAALLVVAAACGVRAALRAGSS